jgi:DNA-binding response OmpR family regulator
VAERVLVVDDDAPVRRMLQRSLAAEGFDVEVAADGGAALVAAERSAPELVILDVTMPGLDGLAVLARLADADARPCVLLVSASLDDDVERAASAAGAAGCIGKHTARADICAQALVLARQ